MTYEKLMKYAAIYTVAFAVFAMSGMLVFAMNQEMIYSNPTISQEEITYSKQEDGKLFPLEIHVNKDSKTSFVIPLPEQVLESDILIEHDYIRKCYFITISNIEKRYFIKNPVESNGSQVQEAGLRYIGDSVQIEVLLDQVYECNSTFKSGTLSLEFEKPQDVLEHIIVIDPGHGGQDSGDKEDNAKESAVVLEIAQKLKTRLETTNIKVYFTRLDIKSNPTALERVQLANGVDADMLISIHTKEENEEDQQQGIAGEYNPDYFIPWFGSVDLAHVLQQEVGKTTGAYMNGLFEALEEDTVVQDATLPAANIIVGNLSNENEGNLLENSEYQQKIADGIYNAIMLIYSEV